MSHDRSHRRFRIAATGLFRGLAWLAAVVGAALVAVLPLAFYFSRSDGMRAAAVAAAACFAVGVTGVLVSEWFERRDQAVAAVLSGMVVRMCLALAICVWTVILDGSLTDAGWVFYFVGFYLVVLAAETRLALVRCGFRHSRAWGR